MYWIEHILA
jgi:hypothetical protein